MRNHCNYNLITSGPLSVAPLTMSAVAEAYLKEKQGKQLLPLAVGPFSRRDQEREKERERKKKRKREKEREREREGGRE